jgi:hypothetical protein
MKEGSRDRTALDVLRVALYGPSAETGDFGESPLESGGCHALAPIVPIDEEARDSPVWKPGKTFGVGSPVFDARELIGRPELTPAYAGRTVVDQSGVSMAFADSTLLVGLGLAGAYALSMEGHAPAATPHAIVPLDQAGEVGPGLCAQGLHTERRHGRLHRAA